MQNLTAIFEESEEGGYTCWIEEIPTAISEGDTIEEAKENLIDALRLLMEANREQSEKAVRGHHNVFRQSIALGAF